MEIIRLVAEGKTAVWNSYSDFKEIFGESGPPFPPVEHLEHIRKNKGEKIIAFDSPSGTILGWIGIIPHADEGYAELAGIEVHKNRRKQGIATVLVHEAQQLLSETGISEFRFQTSPLFTSNTLLYMHKFNTRYAWNNSICLPPDNIPWPLVDCVMKWPSETAQSVHSSEIANIGQSVLYWDALVPVSNQEILNGDSEYMFMDLPRLDLPTVFDEFRKGNFAIAKITFEVFDRLEREGYRFSSFHTVGDSTGFIFQRDIG